jgi:hypothetical protein
MPFVRPRQLFARSMLAWFVLFVGVSVASPLVHPVEGQEVCTSAGARRLVVGANSADQAEGVWSALAHTLDCPACLPGLAPAPGSSALATPSWAAAPAPGARGGAGPVPRAASAPLPARGPPGSV